MDLSKLTILFADAESYYDSKEYTLKKASMTEYIRDARFKAHGFGFAGLEGDVTWISYANLPAYVKTIDWKNTAVVCHNTKFDGAILSWIYGVNPALWIDTVSMAKAVLGAAVPAFSLRMLAERLGLEMQKGEMKTDGIRDLTPEQEEELRVYNRGDIIIMRDLYKRLVGRFPQSQYAQMDWTIRCFTEPELIIDTKLAAETAEIEAKRRDDIIAASGVEKKQLASNPKFQKLLEDNGYECPQKLSPKQKNEDGTPKEIPALALGDEAFLEMLDSDDDKLRAFCEARVAAKSTLLTTRAIKLARIGLTGPWPFDVQFSGAKQTHRYSGGPGGGGNPQNLTRGSALRKCIMAPKGHKLVVGDFANVELRIVAWLCNDAHMIRQITEQRDLYCDFASQHYGRVITKADELERRFGKTAMLGLDYNMGTDKFVKTVFIQLKQRLETVEGRKAVNLFRMSYPGIVETWEWLHNLLPRMLAGEKGVLPNLPAVRWDGPKFILPSGLEIKYTNLHQRPGKRGPEWAYTGFRDKSQTVQTVNIYGGKMLENLAQALAGEICKEAIERIKNDAPTAGMVHDEILQVVYDGWEQDAAENMAEKMSMSPSWWPAIRLNAEVGTGSNWLDAKH